MTEGDMDRSVEQKVEGGEGVSSAPAEASISAPTSVQSPATNWLDQDPVLRDLWSQNLPPSAIAEKLNRSVAAIMTRAARLGLPRRFAPGRKSGQNYESNESKRAARALRVPAGRVDAGGEVSPATQACERICLMCMRKFLSAGRHNRICPTCKGSPEYVAGSSIPDISFGG